MIIKKLALQGFKSFPEKIRIVFHPGITCIIGPNGTGKSNIVDSLIWVLGGKKHRIAKSEKRGDIIFNGNSKMAPMSLADVTLSLSEDSEELKINHRMFRSGESEYRMDGKMVRLKDIQKKLWDKSISESDYFVIEQGAIGSFLNLKPLEKRSLLEEAAGTAYYKDKKRQTQNKLESSEQNLTRLEDIIAEVSRAKNSLKRQASAAIRYRKIREDIRRLTSLNFRKRIDELEKQQSETLNKYNKSSDREKAVQHKLKDKEKDLSELRNKVWEIENAIKKEQEGLYASKSQLSRFESEKDRETKRAEFIKERKADTRTSIAELKKELLSMEKDKTGAQSSLAALAKSLEQKKDLYTQAEKISNEVQNRFNDAQKSLETFRQDYLQEISGQTELKNEAAKLEKEIEIILQQEKKLSSQLHTEKSQLEEIENKVSLAQSHIAEQKSKLDKNEKITGTKSKEMEEIQSSIIQLEEKIALQNNQKDKHQHHLSVLEELAEKEHAHDPAGQLPRSLGILADHIDSDPENAPLIDVFWKNEVKANLVHAQDVLDTLNENKIKRNLLLLHPEGKTAPSGEVFNDPEVLGRLTSRIKAKEKLKNHLSQLGEAAVVRNIKTAVELWIQYPSSDFITLEGDALLSSGYLKPKEKKEGFFAIKQEIKSVKQKIDDVEKTIHPIRSNLAELQAKEQSLALSLSRLQEENDDIKRHITELDKNVHRDASEMKMSQTNIEIIGKEMKVYSDDKHTLFQKKNSLASDLNKTSVNENSLKKKIDNQEKILLEIQEKNTVARKNVFELRSEIELISERIHNQEQRLTRLEQREKAADDKITALEIDIQDSDSNANQCSQTIQTLTRQVNDLNLSINGKDTHLLEVEAELKTHKTSLSEKEGALDSLREELESKKDSRVEWEVKKAEMERDRVNLEESCWQELKKSIEEVKKEVSLETPEEEDVSAALADANEQIQKFSSVNLMAEEEYLIQKKRYDFLLQEKEDLRSSIDSTRLAIKKIDKESKSLFLDALDEVNKNFQDVFSLLFEGGKAELKLSEPDLPLESGVDIIAQPPGKRVQNLNLLSGGEKSLTSLAFFFSLFRYKPTPFCILDEVDAALDDINLGRFLNLMKKIKDLTQFILITHNYKTMEVADYIYGTTMAEPNITSLYSVKIDPKGKADLPDLETKQTG